MTVKRKNSYLFAVKRMLIALLVLLPVSLRSQDTEGWVIVDGDATYENEFQLEGDASAVSRKLVDYLGTLPFVKDLKNEGGALKGSLIGWFVDCSQCDKFWMDRNQFLLFSSWNGAFRITPENGKYKLTVAGISFVKDLSYSSQIMSKYGVSKGKLQSSYYYSQTGSKSYDWSSQVLTKNHKNFSKDHLEDTQFLAGEFRALFQVK
jgi:hypothetical protein